MTRRVRVEQEQVDPDRTAMNLTWNIELENAVGVPMPQGVQQPEEMNGSDSDSEQDTDIPSLTPHRNRRVKTPQKIRRQPGKRNKQLVN